MREQRQSPQNLGSLLRTNATRTRIRMPIPRASFQADPVVNTKVPINKAIKLAVNPPLGLPEKVLPRT